MNRSLSILLTVVMIAFSLTPLVQANTKESVLVEQVGTSGGIPAIKAQVQNSSGVGTYTLLLENPNNGSPHSQILNNTGKATTYVPTNFDSNGTYKYTLYANGIAVANGGVNLVSSKRTPSFVVVTNGTDITIDVKNADDYLGHVISFTSGEYTERMEVKSASMQRAFQNVSGLGPKMTFVGPVGDLVTVDVKRGEITNTNNNPTPPSTNQPTANIPNNNNNNNNTNTGNTQNNSNNSSSSNTNTPPSNNTGGSSQTLEPTISTNGNTSSISTVTAEGELVVYSNKDNISKHIKLSMNKQAYVLDEMMIVDVEVFHEEYAGESITLHFSADSESTTKLIYLDQKGKSSQTFKIPVPQPSTKLINVSTYTISGSLIDQVEAKYSIDGELAGNGIDENKLVKLTYASLDLTDLKNQKAIFSWYGAANIHNYDARLRVINNTTGDEHTYSVFIPDGEAFINLKLLYDGPGIYTWELYVDGKILTKAPYSTPVDVDGTPTSQNGLPVLKTLANENVQSALLESIDPNAVGASTVGEPLVDDGVADDFSEVDYSQQQNVNPEQEGKSKKVIIIVVVILVLLGGAIGFIILKSKSKGKDSDEGFKAYDGEGSEDDDEFKEV